ncbi:MAG: neutral/alkaline non-lysosomal ceramidase N-terminal domain-containing protein [Acinetobacter sp.]|nr:neutral/alkaline non-lysosomal ceramidase N-terminal domain-containing protein [Acinetobacter sp.]MDN5489309.1 neutral/alkaline non-lysosomal ceramidase N-terminal domain-containing protein [Acinetobacter sp.]MDN5624435.1 neutral/alkaline non-lysosomal ceramidase N-terminal domain-containing protein [Acinetobacter sp.]MDN5649149.1 neutral/alkaline non-lysosomal ceramidase N-terminal domain-containing protein [Acinetobacter sp.]
MFMVGWDKQEINIQPQGYAMFGYGMWSHRAYQKRTALFARTFTIRRLALEQPIIFCCLDFGCITYAIRSGVVERLKQQLAEQFNEQYLVLMATHTHSGPGGCAYEALYNMPTPGFVPEHVEAVVNAVMLSISNALDTEKETELRYQSCQFSDDIPVAWNRSLQAYNRNPDVIQRTEAETHLALNREMQLIGFYRDDQLCSFISLFGVHATCLSSQLKAHDGDNKGYAAALSEHYLLTQGIPNPVAIFAQATAGDVSPHFHGPKQDAIRKKIKGEREYQYAEQNGRYQSEIAIKALTIPLEKNTNNAMEACLLQGSVDAVLSYVDLSQVDVPSEFSQGIQGAKTSAACHGVAFFGGTPIDGKGTPTAILKVMSLLAKRVRKQRLANSNSLQYSKYKALYDSQFPKEIVLESPDNQLLGKGLDFSPSIFDPLIAEMNRQVKAGAIQDSPLVPSVIPLQIIQIGQLALICCPGEITTTAGQRVIQTVAKQFSKHHGISKVGLVSYCNDYMGYITTNEEYQQQVYEGAHTLYGQWTHAAIQYKFQQLATQLSLDKYQREYDQITCPAAIPPNEIEKRTNHGNLKTAVR